MEYKIGQLFKIKTYKEITKEHPGMVWNKDFFDCYGNSKFTIERIDMENINDLVIFGTTDEDKYIRLKTCRGEDVVLKSINYINLDDNLFQL